ncbi:MAG TPA: type II toxin-antitoxin system HicB family antitoxin [Ktedonobacterales bacterium]|nr:type II toxin-antitoxin system HicB family antitoxin [Ktedonobacterales bacterium]
MSDEAMYHAYLELQPDGTCLAQVYDLPGCCARGPDQATALHNLEAAIPGYYVWLQAHDEYTPNVQGPHLVSVAGTAQVPAVDGHARGGFFEPAAVPVTAEDLDWYLALLDWAYADLAALLDREDVAQADDVATHVAQTQLWLNSRLDAQLAVPEVEQLPGTTHDRLRQVWQVSLARMRGTGDDERERIVDQDGERWSLRKLLQRSILHVRTHTDDLRQAPGE